MPRPSRLTAEINRLIAGSVAAGAKPVDAARHHGISASTFYDWMRRARAGTQPYRQLADAIEGARSGVASSATDVPNRFIGRNREMSHTRTMLRELGTGRGSVTLLAGEPGIGKTTLLEQIAGLARAQNATLVTGRCYDLEGIPALWPWREAARQLIGAVPSDHLTTAIGAAGPEIAQLIPELHERLGRQPDPPPLAPAEARFRLMDGLAGILARAAALQPVVLLLEDLHWADELSVHMLDFIARDAPVISLACFVTYRTATSPPFETAVAAIARHPGVVLVGLEGLSRSETADMARGVDGASLGAKSIDFIYDRTRGNPFFVREVTRSLASGRDDSVPPSVQALLQQHLDLLDPAARRVLSAAAVFGEEFELGLLEVVVGSAGEAIDAAVARDLVAPISAGVRRYRFRHALIRDVLYHGMAEAQRTALHGAVATALESQGGGDAAQPGVLAGHFLAAGAATLRKGFEYSVEAAERSAQELAYEQAASRYQRALAALALLADEDEEAEAELSLRLGQCLSRAGKQDRARTALRRTLELSSRAGNAHRIAEAALSFGEDLVISRIGAVDDEAVHWLEEAIPMLDPADPLLARVLARLAMEIHFRCETAEQLALIERATRIARAAGDAATTAHIMMLEHWIVFSPNYVRRRRRQTKELLDAAERSGDLFLRCHAHWSRTYDLIERGDVAAADREATTATQLGAQLRDAHSPWVALLYRSGQAAMAGRLDAAEALAGEARDRGLRAGSPNAELGFDTQLTPIRLHQGRLAEIEATARRCAPALAAWRSCLALILVETGRTAEARAHLQHFIAQPGREMFDDDSSWGPGLAHVAMVAAKLRDADASRTLYQILLPHRDLFILAGYAAIVYGSVEYFLGRLASTFEDWDAAAQHFQAAIARNERSGATLWATRSRVHFAEMLLARGNTGDTADAEVLLRDAGAVCREFQLTTLLEEISHLAPLAKRGRPSAVAALVRCTGGWRIIHDDQAFEMPDAKGLAYLAVLLREPDRPFHSLDLAAESSTNGSSGRIDSPAGLGDAGSILDGRARASYRERLKDLRGAMEDAERRNDLGAADRARIEIDFLEGELAGAFGLSGRARRAASTIERARLSVTRAVRRAVERIHRHDELLGSHLDRSLRTGTVCSYEPAPGDPIRIEVRDDATEKSSAAVAGAEPRAASGSGVAATPNSRAPQEK